MSFLLAPTVSGPISECSSSIEVQGQLVGSTVTLFADTRVIASAVATWCRQIIPLPATANLKAGERITATQKDSSGESEHSNEPFVAVQRHWNPVPGVTVAGSLYGCSAALWVTGCVPGAHVEAELGGVAIGKGDSLGGDARFGLSQQLSPGDVLALKQTACGIAGPVTPTPKAEKLPESLPAPTIEGPLIECGVTVTVAGVIPGATVTLERSAGTTLVAVFDAPNLYFVLAQPLRDKETLVASQEFPNCRGASGPSAKAAVKPRATVPAPILTGRLCQSARSAEATNLIPGAIVMLFADGTKIGAFQAPAASFIFQLPPLSAWSKLTLQQQMCDQWSAHSNEVRLTSFDQAPRTPAITAPLYRCGGAVRVTNLSPIGGWIMVHSLRNDSLIGMAHVTAAEMDVPVSPLLIDGDDIVAVTHGCGGGLSSKKEPVAVYNRDLSAPVVLTAVSRHRVLTLAQTIPGARVDLYVNGLWNVSAVVGGETATLHTTADLNVGDSLRLRQRLCGSVSPDRLFTVVGPPVAAFTPSPSSGTAPVSVSHQNQSTGTITKYSWQFDSEPPVTTAIPTSPVHVYSQVGNHTAVLTVEGPGGTSSVSHPILAEQQGFDEFIIHNCNANTLSSSTIHRPIHIYFRLAGGTDVWSPIFDSPINAEYSESGVCPAPGSRGAHLSLDDGKTYEVVCVDPDLPGCDGSPDTLACRRSPVFTVRGKAGGGAKAVTVG